MTNSKGYRRGTRDMFFRAHKKKGVEHLSTYLKTCKIGDIVDVKGCSAFQKAMPYKAHHGKTGRLLFNVSKYAVGVVVNKSVNGKILPKGIRIEHIMRCKFRKDFLDRLHSNEIKKKEAKAVGTAVVCKRFLAQPKGPQDVSTKDNVLQDLGLMA